MPKVFDKEKECVYFTDLNSSYKLYRQMDSVVKEHPKRLDDTWYTKMCTINNIHQEFKALDNTLKYFNQGFYITHYINGTDLHGNKPFEEDGANQSCIPLNNYQKLQILDIFSSVSYIGKQVGYTFGDITCGNILIDNDGDFHLIDYEVIVPWPLPESYVNIWNNTLKIIFDN